ncbi:MAG TPA: hypothetical protein VFO19_11015 [Vicinamibacterales bacterium]|nr:hypothetical protein [Vicinamibacterales bacterium]
MLAPASSREWLRASAIGLALIVVMTYPLVPAMASAGRVNTGDGRFSIWNVGWIDHALLTSPSNLFNANIFHPHPGTLAYSELNLVAGVLGLPAFAVSRNALAAHNFAVALALLLTFVLTWALVRRLTGSAGAGLVSATLFTFCPFVQAHTAHIQLLMAFGFPLVFLALERFHDRPTWGRGVSIGAALATTALACAYYGIFAGLAVGAAALVFARATRQYWLGLMLAIVTAAVMVLPVVVPFTKARAGIGTAGERSLADTEPYSGDATMYLSSPSHLHGALLPTGPESVFPGFLAIGLALAGIGAGLREAPRQRLAVIAYAVVGGLAFWASLGPRGGLYSILFEIVPMIALLRAPVRLGIVVTFALAVLAGFAVRRVAAGRLWVVPALIAGAVVELAAMPWPLARPDPVPEAYRMLASAAPGAVVEFPFMYRSSDYHNHTRYMFGSTAHWKPLVNGYSDLTPTDFDTIAGPINAFPDPASFEILRARGVRYVVWHMDDYNAEARARLLERLPPYEAYLKRLTDDRNVWLYEIVGWPESRGGE